MKSFWRQPYQFFEEVNSAVKARTMLEPTWLKSTNKTAPLHQGLHMKLELREIEFLEDKYRHLYLNQFRSETSHIINLEPGTQKYYSAPIDIFFARFNELVKQGVSPDKAYESCLNEKVNSVEIENLATHYFKQQSGMIYADVDKDSINSNASYMTPYFKARSEIDRKDYLALVKFIKERKEAGLTKKLYKNEVDFATNDDILRYISAHPDDAYFFADLRLIPSSRNFTKLLKAFEARSEEEDKDKKLEREMKTIETEIKTLEEGEKELKSLLNLEDAETESAKSPEKTTEEEMETPISSIEQHIGNIRDLIEDISEEYGIDLKSGSLYDSLDQKTRLKVLNEYLTYMPEEVSNLKKPYYVDKMQKFVGEFENIPHETLLDIEQTRTLTRKKLSKLFENYRKLK